MSVGAWRLFTFSRTQPLLPHELIDSEVLQPTGDLAYAVKNGDHWDIWVYSFDTRQNTQLTSEPTSDQWAPAYSHDGSQLAYLSDQTDGTNQIWTMNPDGSSKRQITNWYGDESIMYVAWSPDDAQFIVTLEGSNRRLVLMSVGGGDFTDFVGPSSSFASTGVKGSMVYSSESDAAGSTVYLSDFYDPGNSSPYAAGDTPNLTPDGMYAVVQIGDPGDRYIETYTLSPYDSAMWSIPRVGDDSNPVWIVPDHAHIALRLFQRAGGNDPGLPDWERFHDANRYRSSRPGLVSLEAIFSGRSTQPWIQSSPPHVAGNPS